MSNITTTNIDLGNVALGDNRFRDETLTLAAAGTAPSGLILARAAGGDLVPFAPTAQDGTEVPRYVLTYPVTFAEAGSQAVRVLMDGRVDKARLIVGLSGDAGDISAAVVDALKDQKITAVDSTELTVLDNQ